MEKQLDYTNPHLILETHKVVENRVSWRSPSNLAIIKYWGKYGMQLPRNPSISFTLENAYTETTLEYRPKKNMDRSIKVDLFFEGQPNEAFRAKVQRFLENIKDIFPFLGQLELTIYTRNSFPHSAGIASSASGMSALALCLCSLEKILFHTLQKESDFFRKASYIARLGSGSACRSVYPVMAVWGESGEVEGSSNLYAIPFEPYIHPIFASFHDDILIVSTEKKAVSSRAGHQLMEENIFASSRYEQAKRNFHHLLVALKTGDVETFGQIAEAEALSLHALMMTSNPPFVLIKPNALTVIEKVQAFRAATGIPLYFSLDAGPNPHLLYPDHAKKDARSFITTELLPYCEDGRWIEDKVGRGPEKRESIETT